MSVNTGAKFVTDQLKLKLDIENKKSYVGTGSTWRNLVYPRNSGTMANGAYYSSNSGGMVVDGVDDYFYISTNNGGQNQYSFSVWFKLLSSAHIDRWFGSPDYGTFTLYNPGNVAFHYNPYDSAYGSSTAISSGVAVGYNQWMNVTITNDIPNLQVRIYINGELKNSGANVAPAGISNISVGNQNSNARSNSSTSEVAYWTKILSEEEVKQCFNASRNRYGI